MGRRTPDLIGAGLLVILGAAFAVGSLLGYEVIDERSRIGPGFMPFATGLMLVLFGALVSVEALMGARGAEEEAGTDNEEEGSSYNVGLIFVLTLAAILLVPLLGFLISFGLLIFALVKFVERESLLLGAGMGAGAALFTWVVFVLFLQIPLPGGVLGVGG